ncbi:MAG TPA: hypothetical protein VHZ03_39310 [Trebonia sp.]|nr:hypothetical protein [Trebonia sp.]
MGLAVGRPIAGAGCELADAGTATRRGRGRGRGRAAGLLARAGAVLGAGTPLTRAMAANATIGGTLGIRAVART